MSKLTPAGSDKGLETHGFSPSGADEQSWAWAVSAARSYLAFGSLPAPMQGPSLVAQRLKRLPAMWETWVRSLGREDPLEEEMGTYSSILAWRIPGTGEPVGRRLWGHTESDTTEAT